MADIHMYKRWNKILKGNFQDAWALVAVNYWKNFTDGGYCSVDWINLAKDRYHWPSLLNTVIFLILKAENFSPIERMRIFEEELCSIRLLCLNLKLFLRLEINFRTLTLNSKNQFWITYYLKKGIGYSILLKKNSYPSQRPIGSCIEVEPCCRSTVISWEDNNWIVEYPSFSQCWYNIANTLVQSGQHSCEKCNWARCVSRSKTFIFFSLVEKNIYTNIYVLIKLSSSFINYLLLCSVTNINYTVPLNYTTDSKLVGITWKITLVKKFRNFMELENFLEDRSLNPLWASSEHIAVSYFVSAKINSSLALTISVSS